MFLYGGGCGSAFPADLEAGNHSLGNIPAQIVRVQGEKVRKYVDEVDQTSVENPTLAKIEALTRRLEELEQKLDEKK